MPSDITQQQYFEMVNGLVKKPQDVISGLTNETAHLWHMATGLAGEAAEVLDLIKKSAIYGKNVNTELLREELGDVEFYLEGLRQGLCLKREDIINHNVDKLTKRYGSKYSDKAAIERVDKSDG